MKYVNEDDSLSYNDIVEKYYLNNYGFDQTLLETLKHIKRNECIGIFFKNFYVQTDSNSVSFVYNVYKSNDDSNFDLWLVELNRNNLDYSKNIMFILKSEAKTILESDEI